MDCHGYFMGGFCIICGLEKDILSHFIETGFLFVIGIVCKVCDTLPVLRITRDTLSFFFFIPEHYGISFMVWKDHNIQCHKLYPHLN